MILKKRANKILFWLGMSLPTVALLAMTWLVHQTSGQFVNSFNAVVHTYKVLDVVEQTQAHVVNAEANRRGYLLTGRADYFSPYDAAMASLNDDIAELKNLTRDNSIQQTNITLLNDMVSERLLLNFEQAEAERTNTPAVILTQRGRDTINQLHHVLFQMRQEEQQLLTQHQQEAEKDVLSSQIMSFVLIGAVAVALIFIVVILLRLEKLQQYVTVCAWTGQVFYHNEWIRLDEYLRRQFGLTVSHSLSKDASDKMMREIEGLSRSRNGPPTGMPPSL